MKKAFTTAIAILASATVFAAEPVVTDVVAKQRYPWNGFVDISCKVTGMAGTTAGRYFVVAAVMPNSGNVRDISHFWVVRGGTNSTDRMVRTNGAYQLLWNAQADLGNVRYGNMVVRVTLVDPHEKVQLWKDGPYWATTNIGAEKPEECGYYFWWGDTVGYKRENDAWVATDGSSSNFSFNHSIYRPHYNIIPTCDKSIPTLKSEGWITNEGWITTASVLVPEHDAAHVHWGGNWRMPTHQEQYDLTTKCDWTWTNLNGVYGYVVKGKGTYASASIFLPCAGEGIETSLDYYVAGGYWSSLPGTDHGGCYGALGLFLESNGGYISALSNFSRAEGLSIRPVQGFTK